MLRAQQVLLERQERPVRQDQPVLLVLQVLLGLRALRVLLGPLALGSQVRRVFRAQLVQLEPRAFREQRGQQVRRVPSVQPEPLAQ